MAALPAMPPPLDSARHPFEQFVLFLGMVVSWPLLLGAAKTGSTAELLGPFLVRVWAWMLFGGCFVAAIGSWWTWWAWLSRFWAAWKPRTVRALMIERLGLLSLGGSSVVYAFGVVVFVGADPPRLVGAGLVTGLGLAAFWRAHQIRRWIRWYDAVQEAAHGRP